MKHKKLRIRMHPWPSSALAATIWLAASGLLHGQLTIISDFNDGIPDWDGKSITEVFEAGGALTMSAQLRATLGNLANSITSVHWNRSLPIRDAQALELRVDLLETSRGDVMAGFDFNATGTPQRGLYSLLKDEDDLMVDKVQFAPDYSTLGAARLIYENTPIKHHDVVLSLTFVGIGSNVQITVRVLDQANNLAVLFERTVLDTPGVDPSINEGPGEAVFAPDPGPPFTNATVTYLYLNQVTDGNQPPAQVLYDNFTYEYRSAAELTVERAVRLSWPAFNTPYVVEAASSVGGPWSFVNEPAFQSNAMNRMTAPITPTEPARFFRLREE